MGSLNSIIARDVQEMDVQEEENVELKTCSFISPEETNRIIVELGQMTKEMKEDIIVEMRKIIKEMREDMINNYDKLVMNGNNKLKEENMRLIKVNKGLDGFICKLIEKSRNTILCIEE